MLWGRGVRLPAVGVVIRQGLKSTALQYVGVAIGIASQLFLYTQVPAEYGLVQVLIAAANVVLPFAMLGTYSLAVRYYPRFREPDAGRQGLLTALLLATAVGLALYLAAAPALDGWLRERYFADTRADYRQYIRYLPALVVCLALIKLLYQYTLNFRRIVVPTFLEQFLLKLTLPALLLAFLLGYIGVEAVVRGVVANYAVALVGMVAYLAYLGQLRLPRPSAAVRAAWRPMAGYAGFGIASMLGTALAFRVDVVMVTAALGFEAGGQYTIVLFIAEVISKPFVNVRAVLASEVSAAWVDDDRATLTDLYRRSSVNLLLVAGYLFGGILVCYASLAQLAVNGEAMLLGGFGAFVLLGLSRVVDSATSINEYVISYSPRYRFNLLALGVLAAANVALNLYLIPRYGLTGAGLATLLSVTAYNAIKVLFAGFAFGIWPFGKTTLVALAGLAACTAAVYALPLAGRWYVDIPLRGGAFTALVAAFAWYAGVSPEAEGVVRKAWARVAGG